MRVPREVQWAECDPAGILFYANYFRWTDAATWALFEAAGYGPKRLRAEGYAMPLVSVEAQFLAPAEHGARCEVRSRIRRFGAKSFVVSHEIARDDGTPLVRAAETRVWGRFSSGPGSPMRGEGMPAELRARLARA